MTDDIAAAAKTDYPLLQIIRTTGWSHFPYLLASIVGNAVATILDRADVFVLGLAFDAMFNEQAYTLPLIPDAWIPAEPMPQLWFTFWLLLAMKVMDVLSANLSQVARTIYTQRTLHDVRVDAFDTAQRLELGFFEGSLTGDVMSVLNNDVNTLEGFFSGGIRYIFWIVFVLATSFGLMVLLNWQLALFVLAAGPMIAGVNWWFSGVLERLEDVVRSTVGELNARLEANLNGVAVIKAYAAEPYERDRVAGASHEHFEAQWDSERISARHRPSMRLISGASLLATFVVGSYWVVYGPPLFFSGTLTAGELIPFLFYMQQLTGPMRGVAGAISTYKRSKAAAKRIVGLRDLDRTIERGGAALGDIEGRVAYDDVRFTYPETDDPVVDGVSFIAEPGETVGLVGSTGAGKSTLVKLLLRFYDVDSGSISIDDRDIRTLDSERLRGAIGYVNQDPFLFDGTVAENIRYGDPAADRPDVERAAHEAGAHEFIQDLPDGYDTQVGQRGVKLSGGQRQRVAIARAVVGDPPILVFDEATSHVDNETEVLIQHNLETLTADRTTFVIAHRLSTVRDADRILVLEDGRLVESGHHDDLLDREGTYADLWNVQVGAVTRLASDDGS